MLVASGSASSSKASRVKLTIRQTGSGEQTLEPANRLKLTCKGTLYPSWQEGPGYVIDDYPEVIVAALCRVSVR